MMFKRTFFILVGFMQIATATSLENILELVETNNYMLKAKETKIRSSKIDVALSNTWSNPVFGIGATDINLNNPTSRDLEAMQTQYITYSQVIPTNGKLKLANDIKEYDTNINKLEYNNYKQKLKSEALLYSYNLYYKNKKLIVLNNYIKNLNNQKKLMNLLYENGKLDQSSLLTVDIKIYKVTLQKQKLLYSISKIKKSLENIVYEKIDTITLSKSFDNLTININNILENHPLILIEKERMKQESQKIELENRNKISDVKFTIGYYQRERFDDYMSFNIAIPLSIQGIEKLKIKKSQIEKIFIKENLIGLQQKIKTTINDLEDKRKLSKQNFTLIDDEMIPLNDTLEKAHKIHLSTNTMQSLSVYESTNSKYELMLLSKDEKINYFDALSKLLYFKGEL